MMALLNHPLYQQDLEQIESATFLPWARLAGSSICLSGATGMIGSCLVDAILWKNQKEDFGCSVCVLSRNREKAEKRFAAWTDSPYLQIVTCDVNKKETLAGLPPCDYVLHLASNTHPVAYATDPIGTITANITGTQNLLEYAVRTGAKRFLFASSNEIYGENRGDTEFFDESYSGYIDCNTLRAGYPESKRCGEALCQAYRKQSGLEVVIARLTRSFGPTLQASDTKALSQFLNNGLKKEDIVLKSAGTQFYSYTYSADAVTGLLTVLLKGVDGEAYNVSDSSCDTQLKDLAQTIADFAGTKVRFELPGQTESLGFSKATKARLDGSKLKQLGWRVHYPLRAALQRTLTMLGETAH